MTMELSIMTSPKVTTPKEGRTVSVGMRTSPKLKELIERAAKEDDRSASQYMERVLIAHFQELGMWPK